MRTHSRSTSFDTGRSKSSRLRTARVVVSSCSPDSGRVPWASSVAISRSTLSGDLPDGLVAQLDGEAHAETLDDVAGALPHLSPFRRLRALLEGRLVGKDHLGDPVVHR